MDALSAAAQSVEAAQQMQQQLRILTQASAHSNHHQHQHHPSLSLHDAQQRQPDATSPVATTPTMRITSILNADPEPESDEADVEFVGIAQSQGRGLNQQRESGFVWRNSAVDPAVQLRGDARHQSNGGMAAVAGGMGTGVGIRWPPDVQRLNLTNDPRADIGARARQQHQQHQHQHPPPLQYQLQHQWQHQQQQQQQAQYHQQSQLEQQSTPAKKKAPAAKRERAAQSPVAAASPAARAKIAKAPAAASILASDKYIVNNSNSPIKMGEKKKPPTNKRTWTNEEKAAFHEAFGLHGKNWEKVAACIPTRTKSQVASFGQKIVRAAAKAADFASSTASKADAASAATNSAIGSGESKQLNLAPVNDDKNHGNLPQLSENDPNHVSQTPTATLALDPVGTDGALNVAPPRVLDLINGESSQRPRRGARHQETKSVVAPQHATLVVAQIPVPAANEVIEINTEDSATETPQKAPQRTTTRPPRARTPSAKIIQQQQQVAMPQRKKPKLAVVVRKDVSSEDVPASPPSSSVASGPPVRSSTSSKPKRGKKRPPQEFDGITSPMNADSTSSSADERACEFCRSARGTCAIMNCTSCKRVYHAKCFVNHFKPYCTSDEPIEKQLESLHLSAPSQVKVKIFRCVPCQAAFIENFRKGGYEWDCECPSCSAPQKIAEYRRRLLLQFVYNKVDEKAPSSKQKNSKQGSKTAAAGRGEQDNAAKPQEAKKLVVSAAAPPTRKGTRRTRNTTARGSENESMEVDSEASVEVPHATLDVTTSDRKETNSKTKNGSNSFANDTHAGSKTGTLDTDMDDGVNESAASAANGEDDEKVGGDLSTTQNGGREEDQMDCEMVDAAVAEPDQEKETSSRASPVSKPSDAAVGNSDPELSETDILTAVPIKLDEGWECFTVVCTETPSLTASGTWKEGVYYLHRDRAKDTIKCPCCWVKHMPRMSREQFVRHADAQFLEMEGKSPWDFLFALHRDGTEVSPLAPFLALLDQRKLALRDAILSSPSQKRKHQKNLKSPLRIAQVQAEDPEAAKTALNDARKQLESVVIARRAAGHAEPKSASGNSSRPTYVIRVVCVSSKLTIPMTDGMVQNKLDWSTPGDFPHKDGWLSFDKGTAGSVPSSAVSPFYANVLCDCCAREMPLEDFILHTGLETWDKKYKRKFVYTPLRDNQRALIELDRVWQAILTLHNHQGLESALSAIPEVVVRLQQQG